MMITNKPRVTTSRKVCSTRFHLSKLEKNEGIVEQKKNWRDISFALYMGVKGGVGRLDLYKSLVNESNAGNDICKSNLILP